MIVSFTKEIALLHIDSNSYTIIYVDEVLSSSCGYSKMLSGISVFLHQTVSMHIVGLQALSPAKV